MTADPSIAGGITMATGARQAITDERIRSLAMLMDPHFVLIEDRSQVSEHDPVDLESQACVISLVCKSTFGTKVPNRSTAASCEAVLICCQL